MRNRRRERHSNYDDYLLRSETCCAAAPRCAHQHGAGINLCPVLRGVNDSEGNVIPTAAATVSAIAMRR
jgi:hypothetical protein